MDVNRLNEAAEKALRARLDALYAKAVRRIIRRTKAFWALLRAIERGEEQPPQGYDEQQRKAWLQARVDMAVEEHGVEGAVGMELASAGLAAGALIVSSMMDAYMTNRRWALERFDRQMEQASQQSIRWPTLTERQVRIILEDSQPPGTKIAYRRLGSSGTFQRRFRRELIAAIRGGEAQPELVRRIMGAMGETSKAARNRAELIAQTERTRVQSQARWEADEEAITQGLRVADVWLCQNIPPHPTASGWSSGSRDSHRALHREARIHGESWTTIHGHVLRYPGDPSAPPSEICRCHCALEPRILLRGEDVVDGRIVRRE